MTGNCNQTEPQPIRFSVLDGNQHIIIYDMGPKETYFWSKIWETYFWSKIWETYFQSKIQAFFNFNFFWLQREGEREIGTSDLHFTRHILQPVVLHLRDTTITKYDKRLFKWSLKWI